MSRAFGLAIFFALQAVQAQAQALSAEEAGRLLIGANVRHHLQSQTYGDFGYGRDGSFWTIGGPYRPGGGVAGGELGLMGTYRIEADGRLCWHTPAAGAGCFRYYRDSAELHVCRDDPRSDAYIGTVTVTR